MKKKEDKQKDLEALRQDLDGSQNLFVTGYEKLTVQQDFELRKTVRGAGGKYKVVKNNLAGKASEGTPAEAVLKDLDGHDLARLHRERSGGAGQGAHRLREDESGVHVQGGHCRRPRRSTSRAINDLATMPSQGRDFCQAAVPDQCSGAAAGDGDERAWAAIWRWWSIRASRKTSFKRKRILAIR